MAKVSATAPIAPPAVDRAALAAATAADALAAAQAADKAARAALLEAMQEHGLERAQTIAGLASVCGGRRTLSVVCPNLKAKIKALTEDGVLTGATVEKTGQPYVMLRG